VGTGRFTVQPMEALGAVPRSSTLSPSPNGSTYLTASENNSLGSEAQATQDIGSEGALKIEPMQATDAVQSSIEEHTVQLQKQLLQLQLQQQQQHLQGVKQPNQLTNPDYQAPVQQQQHSLPPNYLGPSVALDHIQPSNLSENFVEQPPAMQQSQQNLSQEQQHLLQQQQSTTHSLPPVPSQLGAAAMGGGANDIVQVGVLQKGASGVPTGGRTGGVSVGTSIEVAGPSVRTATVPHNGEAVGQATQLDKDGQVNMTSIRYVLQCVDKILFIRVS